MGDTSAPTEQAKRRAECWQGISRGIEQMTRGLMQIIAALAKYYAGESLTTR